MKRLFIALLILTMLLFTLPALAQEAGTAVPTDTDTPAETAEPTAAATDEAIETQDVIIIVTQTPSEDATPAPEETPIVIIIEQPPVEPAPPPVPEDNTFERLALLALLLLLIVDKISGHFLSLKLANMVPMEWRQVAGGFVENAQRTGLQTAYARVKATEDTWDDSVLFEGAKIIGWEFITNPDGSVTAQRIKPTTPPPVVSPQG